MAGTDVDAIYDRLQERFSLEDLDDDEIAGALLANFTERKTKHSGTVDLTSKHTVEEWKDHVGGTLRPKEVKGFTPRLSKVVDKIKELRDKAVAKEISPLTKPLDAFEPGTSKILEDREEELEKWRKVRTDVDDLIRDNVTRYRDEISRAEEEAREVEKELKRAQDEEEKNEIAERKVLAQEFKEAQTRAEREEAEEELRSTRKGAQSLGGIRSGEKRRVPAAARSIFDLEP